MHRRPVPTESIIEVVPSLSLSTTTFTCLKCGKVYNIDFPATHVTEKSKNEIEFPSWAQTKIVPPEGTSILCDASGVMKLVEILYDHLSTITEVDYPRCTDCCEKHLDDMGQKLKMLIELRDAYEDQIERLGQIENTSEEDREGDEELQSLTSLVKQAEEEYERLLALEREVEEREKTLEENGKTLSKEEEAFWVEWNLVEAQQAERKESQLHWETRLDSQRKELTRLMKTNVLNECFHLSVDGHYATVNGLRIGKLPTPSPEATEVNAAWSNLVLLLMSLASAVGLQFARFTLVQKGSFSYVETKGPRPEQYELYQGAGGWFPASRHDKGISMYMVCLEQLVTELKRKYAGVGEPPVAITIKDDDVVVGKWSVMMNKSSGEGWTMGMKNVVTILKWCVKVVAA
eukprot:PhF_6_TR3303/c0_g1_i1/m.4656/K08334/BECN, VPS30, ATG6; beclin